MGITLRQYVERQYVEHTRLMEQLGLFDEIQPWHWEDAFTADKLDGILPLTISREWLKGKFPFWAEEKIDAWLYTVECYQTSPMDIPAGSYQTM